MFHFVTFFTVVPEAEEAFVPVPGLHAGARLHAREGIDLLAPIRRQRRIGAGGEAHRVAAEVVIAEKVPRAGLHLKPLIDIFRIPLY